MTQHVSQWYVDRRGCYVLAGLVEGRIICIMQKDEAANNGTPSECAHLPGSQGPQHARQKVEYAACPSKGPLLVI